ncbi:MAG TPA: hypothetical protein VF471_06075 [Pseudoxanthomonas sp.]
MSHIGVDENSWMTNPNGAILFFAALFLTITLVGCGGSVGSRYAEYDDYYNDAADADQEAAEEAAQEAAEEARQEAYAEAGASSDGTGADASNVSAHDIEKPSFDYCTQDCSGHEAGFEWARDNEVTDESDCGGNSQSFYDGCVQFADERQEQADMAVQEEAERAAEEAAQETAAETESDAGYENDDF